MKPMGDSTWDERAPHRTTPQKPPVVVQQPRVIRVSDDRDGVLLNRGYSYWAQSWVSGRNVYVFCGAEDGTPRLFDVGLAGNGYQDSVSRVPWILPYRGTTEGMYWDRDGWIYLCEGPRLRRVNPFTGEDDIIFDVSPYHPHHRLWQAHSSDDGRVHSATVDLVVESGPYPHVGTIVYREGLQTFYEAVGALDESQVTPDGAYLVIKENDDNRIVTLATGEERMILDADGAVGHSDVGHGFVVGEDNMLGACVSWNLPVLVKTALFPTWSMGHVAVRGSTCILSGPQSLSKVPLEGGAPEWLCDHGMVGEGYDAQVMGNLSPDGSVVAFASNKAGRMDMYLLVL